MTELDRASLEDIQRLDTEPELVEIYARQADEWQAISKEMSAARIATPVTAYQVSVEQRRRWLERGELPWWKQPRPS